jgi:hypothetical protein
LQMILARGYMFKRIVANVETHIIIDLGR